MTITDIRIRETSDGGRMRAVVSIVLDNKLVVNDIKIIEGQERFFLAMPSRRLYEGGYRDIVHPVDAETRAYFEESILSQWNATVGSNDSTGSDDVDVPGETVL